MPFIDMLIEGAASHLGSKVVDHFHKKLMGQKKRKNPAESGFIGVRINSGKVQLKLPNKNPGTLAAAKKVASKLGYRINPKSYKLMIVPNNLPNLYANTLTDAREKAKNAYKRGATSVEIIAVATGKGYFIDEKGKFNQ